MSASKTCPRCKIKLKVTHINERGGNIEVDKCPKCKGIWFDKGELDELEKIVEPVFIEFRKIPSPYDQLEGLWCASCEDVLMEKQTHPRDEKVIIDICPNCEGVWLDAGELEAIQRENWVSALLGFFDKLS